MSFSNITGTMKTACDLCTSMGGEVALALVCIELEELNGRQKIDAPLCTLIQY